jgi:hypothetical protein
MSFELAIQAEVNSYKELLTGIEHESVNSCSMRRRRSASVKLSNFPFEKQLQDQHRFAVSSHSSRIKPVPDLVCRVVP